jgi:hypothetical protein
MDGYCLHSQGSSEHVRNWMVYIGLEKDLSTEIFHPKLKMRRGQGDHLGQSGKKGG